MRMLKMIRKNRKKLDNKGFTLIELLAVIVILAIVMGISAQSVLTSINNSRKSSLYSAAQTAANQLNQWVTEDAVVSEEGQKMLGQDFVVATQQTWPNEWFCLDTKVTSADISYNVKTIRNRNGKTTEPDVSLLTALGINKKDIVLRSGEGNSMVNEALPDITKVPVESVEDKKGNTCSSLRYNTQTSAYEILLIAKNGGKYYVTTDKNHYAFSRATDYNKLINE